MRKNFLFEIALTVVLAIAADGIIMNFYRGAFIAALVAFGCGIGMAINLKSGKEKEAHKGDSRFEVIGTGFLIGMCFAVVFGFMFGSGRVCLFSFVGAILGAVVGLLYKKN